MSRLRSTAFLMLLTPGLLLVGCASGGARGTTDSAVPRVDANVDGAAEPDGGAPLDDDAGEDGGPKDFGVEIDLALCDDADGDGYPRGAGCAAAMDCDDGNVAVSPAGTETCNALDDDCDGSVDEDFGGTVSCGVGACTRTAPECDGGRTDTCAPGASSVETCNAIDDDCDGMADEDFGGATTCGVGACERTVSSCAGGMPGSCTPGAPTVETCNAIDDDCNGAIDEGLPALVCGVGTCQRTVPACSGGAPQSCVPGAAGTEICNAADDDCNGAVDDGIAALGCGVGSCARTVVACIGGIAQPCTPGTPGVEACNGADDNCNGSVDEGLGTVTCGVGACQRSTPACAGGTTVACTPGSAGTETCNGVDDDCDGTVDDGVCGPTAPSNDTCAAALLLTGASGTRGDTLVGATANTTDCGYGGVEVFYRVDVGVRSLIYLDTFGTGFDTNISYRGTGCPGSAIGCEDDDCGTLQDQIVVVAAPGTHYFAVHTHASYVTPGPFSIRWQVMTAAAGTNTRITGAGSFAGATSGSSGIGASCGGSAASAENGYHWTQCVGATRTISADTCTATYDTVLHMLGPTGAIACDDDTCGSLHSQLTGISTSGVGLFQLVADGFSSSASGSYTLAVTSF